LFGGDLETAGWKTLLLNRAFRARLLEVKVLVASHHGRESGKCEELFWWCRPDLIVFSDGPKEYDTQETTSWYYQRANGIPDWSQPASLFGQPRRYVMTTRNDGTIRIGVAESGRWDVTRNPRSNPFLAGLSALSLLPPIHPRNLLG
jgi:hypothetical protein